MVVGVYPQQKRMLQMNRQFVCSIKSDLTRMFLCSGRHKVRGLTNSDFVVCEVARPAICTTLSDNSHLYSTTRLLTTGDNVPQWDQEQFTCCFGFIVVDLKMVDAKGEFALMDVTTIYT